MPSSCPFAIRPATADDAVSLPALENAAGALFRTLPDLAHLADGVDLSVERYEELISAGASWVTVDATGNLVGFLNSSIEQASLHVWELGVHPCAQRRGLGRQLMKCAVNFARLQGCGDVTLTTFRHVPWNAPFYRSIGFDIFDPTGNQRLVSIMNDETRRGLEVELRCAMRLPLDTGS